MRWTRNDVQVFFADLFVVLIPVTLVFATLGLPGWRVAGVEFRLYQVLLFISLPFALVQSGFRPLRDAWHAPGVPWIALSLALSVLSTFFYKEMSMLEAREVKNTILPIVLSYVVILGFATSFRRMRWLLMAAMIGITMSLIIVSSGLLSISFGVRPISQLDLFETFGLTYIWLGVGSATVLGLASWVVLGRGARLAPRVLLLIVIGLALVALFASGTRAAFAAAFLTPCLVYASARVPSRLINTSIVLAMVLLTVVSLSPDLLLQHLDTSQQVIPADAEGAARLTMSEAYQGDFVSRLVWWKWMQQDGSLSGLMFGIDYDNALMRTGMLGHPHNILVWARIMAGLPAALALAYGLTGAFIASVRRLQSASPDIRSLATLDVYLMCLLIPVLLTNSWPGGTLLVFALTMALASYLSRADREREQERLTSASTPTFSLTGDRAAQVS